MLVQLDPNQPDQLFPDVDNALQEPNGLLAVGGDLSPTRLIQAYRKGIFPWYSLPSPILWWSPDPRMIFLPELFKPKRSLAKILRRREFTITWDQAFEQVIQACAAPRKDSDGTWITNAIIDAYIELHRLGIAHSVESWHNQQLVGGLYGLAIGQVFFGESMFSRTSNASKAALATFLDQALEWNYQLVDCQVYNDHLASLGAISIPRREFSSLLKKYCDHSPSLLAWQVNESNLNKI